MAIVVEEEKTNSNTPAVLGWLIIVVIVLASAYYIFFAAAPAVVVPPPPNFESIAPIAQISFDPTTLVSSPAFQALKQYIAQPTSTGPVPVGKSNPFLP